MILLIVESPAKCKKIESFLGSGYRCVASKGHIRDLATSGKGGLGMQQYMQLAFSAMLVLCGVLVYMNVSKNIVLVCISVMIIFVVGQTYTQSCLLGKIIPKSTFIPIKPE